MKYLNRTGINSPKGKIVKLDTRGVVLTAPSDTDVLGVVAGVSGRYVEVTDTGLQQVFIYNRFTRGDIVYLRKMGQPGQPGDCFAAASPTLPYLKIGEVTENGDRQLAWTKLDIKYTTTSASVGGTVNRVAKFTAVDTVGDSGISDDGTNVTTSENIKIASDSRKMFFGTGSDMTIWYDGTDGNINTADIAASDLLITTGAAKTIELQTVVWDDLRIIPGAFEFAGTGDPSLVDWQPGGSGTVFKVYAFTSGAGAYFTVQLPHLYKEGTSLYAHVHWTPKDRGNEENGKTVAWKLDYSWANYDGNFGASATVDLTDTCDGTDHKHQMTPNVEIVGTSKTISSMLICKIYRDTGDSWAGTIAAQSPALLEVDFHFSSDTLGSRLIGTK